MMERHETVTPAAFPYPPGWHCPRCSRQVSDTLDRMEKCGLCRGQMLHMVSPRMRDEFNRRQRGKL